jgi:hypothetical protein
MHRSGTLKALQEIEKTIRQEQSTGELLTMFSRVLDVAEAEINASRIEVVRMNQMAEYLAGIRYLLDRLGSDPARKSVSFAAKVMAMRYRDLEGRVKEIRNDCAAKRT